MVPELAGTDGGLKVPVEPSLGADATVAFSAVELIGNTVFGEPESVAAKVVDAPVARISTEINDAAAVRAADAIQRFHLAFLDDTIRPPDIDASPI